MMMMVCVQYEDMLKATRLEPVLRALSSSTRTDPLSHHPAGSPAALTAALAQFSRWLSRPDIVRSPRLGRLVRGGLHDAVHHGALARVVWAYEALSVGVRDEGIGRYEAPGTLLGGERPFGQGGLLWAIFGLKAEEWAR